MHPDDLKSTRVTGSKSSSKFPELPVPVLDIYFRCTKCNWQEWFNVWASGPPRCMFCTGAPYMSAVQIKQSVMPEPLNEHMRNVDRWKDEAAKIALGMKDTGH